MNESIENSRAELNATAQRVEDELDPENMQGLVDDRIDRRLSEDKAGKMFLPTPEKGEIEMAKDGDGDDEIGFANATPRRSDVSGVSALKEKDASTIEYRTERNGKSISQVSGRKSIATEQEMHARMSQGPPIGKDISQDARSRHATEIANVDKS